MPDKYLDDAPLKDESSESDFNVWTDTLPLYAKKFGRGVDIMSQAYHASYMASRLDLSDEEELNALKNFKISDESDEDYKSAPWAVQMTSDAVEILPGMGSSVGAGLAGGTGAAANAAPLAAGASRIPVIGIPLSAAVEAGAFDTGYFTGSVTAIGAQTFGETYNALRTQYGASRNLSRGLATVAGGLNAGLEFTGLHALQKLGGKFMTAGQKKVLTKALTNPAFKKVEENAVARFGLSYAEQILTESGTEGLQDFNNQVAGLATAYIERGKQLSWDNVGGDFGDASKTGVDTFLHMLAVSAVLGAGTSGAGYVIGKGKGATQNLTPDQIKEALQALEGKSIHEIVQNMRDAIDETNVAELGEKVHYTQDEEGRFQVSVRKASQEELDATAGPTMEQIAKGEADVAQTQTEQQNGAEPTQTPGVQTQEAGSAQTAPTEGAQAGPVSQAVDAAKNIPGPIGEFAQAVDAETTQALDALFPGTFGFESDTPSEVVDTRPLQPDTSLSDLTPQEVSARSRQIASDLALLRVEQRRLEGEFTRREKTGLSTNQILNKLESLMQAQEQLDFEQEVLESGLLTREDVAAKAGRQRMSAIAKLVDRVSDMKDRMTQQAAQFRERLQKSQESNLEKGVARGQAQQRQMARELQKQLTQVVNASVSDKAARAKLYKIIAESVNVDKNATRKGESVFEKKMQQLKDGILDAQKNEAIHRTRNEKAKILDAIDKILKHGKVKMQSGKPVSGLDADTTAKLQTFREFVKDEANGGTKAVDTIQAFVEKHGEDVLTGNADVDPAEMLQYQLAVMANGLGSRTPMELNIIRGNLAQWLADGQKAMEQKKAELKAQREAETAAARNSVGLAGFEPIEGQATPAQRRQQFADSLGTQILTWDQFLEFISPNDPEHQIRDLLNPDAADRAYHTARETVKLGALQQMQQALTAAGYHGDVQSKIESDSDTKFELTYITQTGKRKTSTFSKAEIIDIYMKMRDDTLHDTMRDTDKGNNWTLRGDTPPGQSLQDVVDAVMQPEDVAMADALMDFYDTYHARVNAAYRDKFGVDLPQRENYSPLDRKGYDVKPDSKAYDNLLFSSLLPGSAKSRTSNLFRINPRNAYNVLSEHVDQWEHFINRDTFLGTLKNVIKDGKLRQALSDRHGRMSVQVMDDYAKRFIIDSAMPSDRTHPIWAALRSDMARFGLGFKAPYQMAVQLTSGMAMWRNHSTADIIKGIATMAQNIPETEKALRSSDVLRHRFKEGATFDLANALHRQGLVGAVLSKITGHEGSSLTPTQYSTLTNLMFAGIRYGDAGAARLFGGPLYWAERNNGASHEEALAIVEQEMQRTQQSDAVSQVPHFYATNPVVYTFIGQFTLQPMQLNGHAMIATREMLSGRLTQKKVSQWAKKMLQLWVGPGLLFGLVKTLPSLFFPPSEDDDRTRKAITDIVASGIMGPASGIPLIGHAIETAWWLAKGSQARGQNDPATDLVLNANETWKAFEKAYDQDEMSDLSKDPSEHIQDFELKLGRLMGQGFGIPQALFNIPISVSNSLRKGDYVGAMFGLGGWSPSMIKKRQSEDDAKVSDKDFESPDEPIFDIQKIFNQGIAESEDANDEEAPDYQQIFNEGMSEGATQNQ